MIHRNLKPGNDPATEHNGRPVPKVIDLRIAEATGQRLTGRTPLTDFRLMVGTPQ